MILATEAWKLYGDNWQKPLERLIGVPQRKLSRMLAAGAIGRDYPGSADALEAYAAKLKTLSGEASKAARVARRRGTS